LVVFDGAEYWLVDGFHRRWAAVKAKVKQFKCRIVQGTREDARWLSYSVNIEHGLRRTNEDKKKAVVAALKHPKGATMSDGKIAEHVGVSDRMVAKYRQHAQPTPKDSESPTRTGRDGRTTNTANIGSKRKKPPASEAPKDNGKAAPKAEPARTANSNDQPAKQPVQEKESEPFRQLKHWWEQADETTRCLFRNWIDGKI
jgi:ParB-like chromosome segregation protein Spo0J